jgi:YggT family protein
VDRYALADFVSSLYYVYLIMILAYIVLSILPLPYSTTLGRIREFLDQTVSPFLNIFRRFLPSFGGLDFSPMLGILVLSVLRNIIVGVLTG